MVGSLILNMFKDAIKLKLPLNLDDIFHLIEHIIHDREASVRSSLVERLPHMPILCVKSTHKDYSLLVDNLISRIVDIILIYLRDSDNQVRLDAQAALIKLLDYQLLDVEILQDICVFIVELSRNKSPERQTLALTLMTKLMPCITRANREKLFLNRFLELSASEGFFVRRVCATIIGEFFTKMPTYKKQIYNKLLATYTNLCLDSTWGVRKTAVDVMMSVARCVRLPMRRLLLSKLLVRHLCDDSRWVRRSAYEILGPFISTFAKEFSDLIYDEQGDLVLVHGTNILTRRVHVVPVAKVSELLTENLNIFRVLTPNEHEVRRAFNGHGIDTKKKRAKKFLQVERAILKGSQIDRRVSRGKMEELTIDIDCKDRTLLIEQDNYNLFQYYHNPPDMPLDLELVNSIINDNQTPTNVNDNQTPPNTNDNQIPTETTDNQSLSNVTDNQTEENSTEQETTYWAHVQVHQDNNKSNESNEQQQDQQDSNDNNEETVNQQSQNENEQDSEKDNSEEEEEEDEDEIDDELKFSDRWLKLFMLLDAFDDRTQDFTNTVNGSNNSTSDINTTYNVSTNHMSMLLSLLNLNSTAEEEDNDEIVPRMLVEHFISMTNPASIPGDVGLDLDYHCAFCFPAVVLTLGQENWYRLKDAYQRLASTMSWKVRSTLASGIHEIAIIIGEVYTARDLVPIYNSFITDLDEVKIGALKHLSTFLRVLDPLDRMQYLSKLNDFLIPDNKWNWRLREELVKQLSIILPLYKCADVACYIAPLLLHLIQDRVAAVREQAIIVIQKTMMYMCRVGDGRLMLALIQEMRDLLKSCAAERWIIRQTYARICSNLARSPFVSPEIFARELLPYLLELCNDRVPNVRLVVARTLARDVVKKRNFPEADTMRKVQQKLKEMEQDSDRDVRAFASEVDTDVFY